MSEKSKNGIVFDKSTVLLAPDPISNPELLCAGTLLYFDKPIFLTTPPQVITGQSFELLDRIKSKNPEWAPKLFSVLLAWREKREATKNVLELLKPLAKEAFYTAILVYPGDDAALKRAKELIASSGWTLDRFLSVIEFESACGELVRHIFLEKYLELGRDLDGLYEYIASVFREETFPSVLAPAYALRLLGLLGQSKAPHLIALTNARLLDFLADLPGPVAPPQDRGEGEGLFQKDAISMMVFNALVGNWLDPLTQERVEVLASLRKSKRNEIDRFKGKCLAIADNIDLKDKPELIFEEVDRQVRFTVLPEVRDLLELGDRAFQDYKEKLFGDSAFWAAFIGTIVSSMSGTHLLAAGAAVTTLARMGATGVSHYSEIRRTVRRSDYSLLYTVSKLSGSRPD
jgi:hypothetical protein